MVSIDADFLLGWLTQQRWFGSKARELSGVNLLEVINLDDQDTPPVMLALCEARFLAGTHELYQLLLSAHPSEAAPHDEEGEILASDGWTLEDALADEALVRRVVDVLREGRTVTGRGGAQVVGHWVGGELSGEPEVRFMGAEQSNSSVVIDGDYVLKAFRRLEAGDNPELEMTRFLTDHGFAHVPQLAGWLELRGEVMDATLAIVQGFVHGGRDGWDLCLDELVSLPDSFLPRARDLGAVTGELHTVLASDATDPAFAPEEASHEGLALLTATIDEQIDATFLDLPEDHEALAPIAGRGEELRDLLQSMSHVGVGGKLIRHHGDYHLGQCLLSEERGWVVLDFEGEPARSIRERRRKRSPLRDVAGMLRSFAYAASAAELQRGATVPPDWEERCREVFLEGYFGAVEPSLMPAGEAATRKLLAIYELEKAVYELRYELNNRPDWVTIPVRGIARLLQEEAAA
jgi:trehalose synthase-fused probable maltokinase